MPAVTNTACGRCRSAGWATDVVSSETCAFDVLGAEFVRDVEPGEIVTIDQRGHPEPRFLAV